MVRCTDEARSSSFRRLLIACSVQAACQMTGVSVRLPLSVYIPQIKKRNKV